MFAVLGKLGWFFKKYWKRYTAAIILLLVVNVLEIIPPKLLGNAIDDIQTGNFTSDLLVEYIVLFIGLGVLVYFLSYFWMYSLFGGAHLAERILRSKLMGQFLVMTPRFYEKTERVT